VNLVRGRAPPNAGRSSLIVELIAFNSKVRGPGSCQRPRARGWTGRRSASTCFPGRLGTSCGSAVRAVMVELPVTAQPVHADGVRAEDPRHVARGYGSERFLKTPDHARI